MERLADQDYVLKQSRRDRVAALSLGLSIVVTGYFLAWFLSDATEDIAISISPESPYFLPVPFGPQNVFLLLYVFYPLTIFLLTPAYIGFGRLLGRRTENKTFFKYSIMVLGIVAVIFAAFVVLTWLFLAAMLGGSPGP